MKLVKCSSQTTSNSSDLVFSQLKKGIRKGRPQNVTPHLTLWISVSLLKHEANISETSHEKPVCDQRQALFLGICAHASKLLRPPSIQLLYLDPQKIFLHIVGTRDLKVTLTPLSTPEIILFTIKPLPHLLIIHSSPQLTLRVSLYHHASQMLMI